GPRVARPRGERLPHPAERELDGARLGFGHDREGAGGRHRNLIFSAVSIWTNLPSCTTLSTVAKLIERRRARARRITSSSSAVSPTGSGRVAAESDEEGSGVA